MKNRHKHWLLPSVMVIILFVNIYTPLIASALSATPSSDSSLTKVNQAATSAATLAAEDIPFVLTTEILESNGCVRRLREEETTLNSALFQNIDGSKTEYIFPANIKYFDSNGVVQDKSLTITSSIVDEEFSNKYSFAVENTDARVYLPDQLNGDDGVVLKKDKYCVELWPLAEDSATERGQLTNQSLATNTKTQQAIEYSNALGANTSLRYTPVFNGYKEDLILYSRPNSNRFSFGLSLDNLTPVLSEKGAISLVDSDTAAVIGEIARIYVYDSDDLVHETFNNQYEIVETNPDEYVITMVVDAEFLNDPNTVYPVVVDPTVQMPAPTADICAAIDDTILYSARPDSNFSDNYYASLGYVDSSYGTGYMVVKFPGLNSCTAFSRDNFAITSVTYNVTKVGGSNGYWAAVGAYAYTGNPWVENTATYNTIAPITTSNYGVSQGTVWMCSNSGYSFDITDAVKQWRNDSVRLNKGLILKNETNNSNADYCRVLATSEYAVDKDATALPYLSISFYAPVNISSGVYSLKNKSTSKYMDVENESLATGAPIQQSGFYGTNRNLFQVTKQLNGFYTIKSLCSDLYVGVENNSPISGKPIKQYAVSGTGLTAFATGQKWAIYESATGSYFFVPQCAINTITALSVPASGSVDGTDLVQRTYIEDSDYSDEWYFTRIIPEVPCEIFSNEDHTCIPTAISHITAYWGRHGYSGFGGLTTAQLETMGRNVQAAMISAGGIFGHLANVNIPAGFALFSSTDGTTTYKLQPTAVAPADWDTLVSEINAGRPLELGFASGGPYAEAHATVCVGYEICGNTLNVVLSDGHHSYYVIQPFNSPLINDYMATVSVVEVE